MKPSWEEINAYVDGELAPEEAAAVAAAIAADASLAMEVARLAQLKATLAGGFGPAPCPVPPVRLRHGRHWPRAVALAAVMVGGIVVSAIVTTDILARLGTLPENSTASPLIAFPAGPVPVQVGDTRSDAVLPDLANAGLRLVSLSATTSPDGSMAIYQGSHGCRVSLWVGPEAGLGRMSDTEAAGPHVHAWHVGTLGFVLTTNGMDPNRRSILNAAVEAASRNPLRPSPEVREALAQVPITGQACVS